MIDLRLLAIAVVTFTESLFWHFFFRNARAVDSHHISSVISSVAAHRHPSIECKVSRTAAARRSVEPSRAVNVYSRLALTRKSASGAGHHRSQTTELCFVYLTAADWLAGVREMIGRMKTRNLIKSIGARVVEAKTKTQAQARLQLMSDETSGEVRPRMVTTIEVSQRKKSIMNLN